MIQALPVSLLARISTAELVVPVLSGPGLGIWWRCGANSPQMWLGLEDRVCARSIQSLLPRGGVFYDLGAGTGFCSLVAARKAGPGGTVYSFESNPRDLSYLHDHVDLNQVRNVRVLAMADGAFSAGALAACRGMAPPDVIRVFAPGEEIRALHGCRALLAHRPAVLVSACSGRQSQSVSRFLSELNYRHIPEAATESLLAVPA